MMASVPAIAVAALVVVTGLRFRPHLRRPETNVVTPQRSRMLAALREIQERRSDRGRPNPLPVAAWCDDLARHVRSGATLRDALTTVTPTDRSSAAATAPIRLGLSRGRSILETIDDCPEAGPHLHLALRVIRTVADVGGASPIAIDRTAITLRQRSADRDERRVHAAQARLSAHVLTAVPLLMLAALVATDPDVRSTIGSTVGAACVAVGLTANAVGWLWMQRLVKAEP